MKRDVIRERISERGEKPVLLPISNAGFTDLQYVERYSFGYMTHPELGRCAVIGWVKNKDEEEMKTR